MEEWQKEFWQQVDLTGEQVGLFLGEVAQEVSEVAHAVGLLSEEMTLQWRDTATTIESSVTEWLIPVFDAWFGPNSRLDDIIAAPSLIGEPWIVQHPVCVGCRHYHGQVYGGNPLVCGMHPYGVETETCPDREEAAGWSPSALNASRFFFLPPEDEEW
jgi:hypothetical protein